MFDEVKDISQLNGEEWVKAKEIERVFTELVDEARRTLPCGVLRMTTDLFYNLVGKQITPCAISPSAQGGIHFMVVGKSKDELVAVVVVPPNWAELVKQDRKMQMGGVVYTASKAKDFATGGFQSDPEGVEKRAKQHEAAYLHSLREIDPDWTPNEYQRRVMMQFPEGLG